jgi:ATP-dependent DNA ligase
MAVPAGDGWLHEVKFDGHRVQGHQVGSRIVMQGASELPY